MYTERSLNAAIKAVANMAEEVSLHTSEPDDSGSGEVSGGDYKRQDVPGWGDPSKGEIAIGDEVEFEVPENTTLSWAGLWDSDGDFLVGVQLDTDEKIDAAEEYTLSPLVLKATNAPGEGDSGV